MFNINEAAKIEVIRNNRVGIQDEDIKYLMRIIKYLYKEYDLDENGNKIIDKKTGKPKMHDALRRSGQPKYMHPYAVATLLYRKGYTKEYIVTALFHDIIEDTNYTLEDVKSILGVYLNKYQDAVNKDHEEFIDEVTDAVDRLTKVGKFSRPKAPILETKNKEIDTVNPANIENGFKGYEGDHVLVRKPVSEEDLTENSYGKFKEYKEKFEDYDEKMNAYIEGIKESDIAKIVKVADRICNLIDFSPTDSSVWLDKYLMETGAYFIDLADKTDLEDDFLFAIRNAFRTKEVKEQHEKGNKKELSICK